jgi:HK97 family phage portal protein
LGVSRWLKDTFASPIEAPIEEKANQSTRSVDLSIPVSSTGNTFAKRLQLDFPALTRWAYRGNDLVRACIDERTKALKEAPLKIYTEDDDTEVEKHPVEMLLRHPNDFRSQAELIETIEQHLSITGNAFVRKIRDRSGTVRQLWVMPPHMIEIIPDPFKFIKEYVYTVDGIKYPIDPVDVIHILYIDPENEYYGLAPLVSAAKRIDADSELGAYLKTVLLNMAVTSGVFETDKSLGKQDREELEDTIRSRYTGSVKAGLPMLLSSGMKWQQTSMNLKELEVGNISAILETRICMAFHIPALLVGAKAGLDKATYSNVTQARVYMYENTIRPEWSMIADKLGNSLLDDFGETDKGVVPRFDIAKIGALQTSESEKWKRVLDVDFLSDVEKRVYLGYPAAPKGTIFKASTQIAVDISKEPTEPVEPQPTQEEDPTTDGKPPEKKKNDDINTKANKLALPTKEQNEKLKVALVNLESEHLPLMRKACEYMFTDIVAECESFLRKGNFKSMNVKANVTGMKALRGSVIDIVRQNLQSPIANVIDAGAENTRKVLGGSFSLPNEEATKFANAYTTKLADGISDSASAAIQESVSRGIAAGLPMDKIQNLLGERMSDWPTARADMVARTETIRAANEGSLNELQHMGVSYKQWIAAADACDECLSYDGVTEPIENNFVEEGDVISTPGGSDEYDYMDIDTPPVHPNCRCTITGVDESDVESLSTTFKSGDDFGDMDSWILNAANEERDALGDFNMAINEALQNAAKNSSKIDISVQKVGGKQLTVMIRDYSGKGFVPETDQWVMPQAFTEAGEVIAHGRGLPMLNAVSDNVQIIAKKDGTLVRLTKNIKKVDNH